MPITTHVTSLELSRRLKELKVPQNSHFWWTTDNLNFTDDKCTWLLEPTADSYARRTSAYIASELGEFIGNSLENGEDKNIPKELKTTSIQDIWKPDYLAKLLIWLLENHLISVEELGK